MERKPSGATRYLLVIQDPGDLASLSGLAQEYDPRRTLHHPEVSHMGARRIRLRALSQRIKAIPEVQRAVSRPTRRQFAARSFRLGSPPGQKSD